MTSKQIQPVVLAYLERVKFERPDLIPESVNVHEEYCISRSFRRGATTHARKQGVKKRDIDATNRWRGIENTQGKRINQAMRDHYSEISWLLPTLLRFSKAL